MELAACTSMAALAADSLAVIYSTCASRICLHKLTLCLWQFWRLRLGDRRSCIGFNLEMNAMYANGSEYTNVSSCKGVWISVMHVVLVDSLGKLCTDCIFLDGFKFYE
ncbi:hypothetical protein Tco_0809504, partial [Tanacetum coccineum]